MTSPKNEEEQVEYESANSEHGGKEDVVGEESTDKKEGEGEENEGGKASGKGSGKGPSTFHNRNRLLEHQNLIKMKFFLWNHCKKGKTKCISKK